MIALPKHKMTIDEFLIWSEHQPKEAGKFELWDGAIIEKHGAVGTMNAEKSKHWRLRAKLYKALDAAFVASGLEGEVVIDGATVPMPNRRAAEPDVLVYIGPPVGRDELVVPNPIIVCEVLSPSTARFDLTTKLQGYFELPSVMHYIVGDPDAPHVMHHWRDQSGTIEKRFMTDPQTPLRLDPPGLQVDLCSVLTP